jgi:hypothetical protein
VCSVPDASTCGNGYACHDGACASRCDRDGDCDVLGGYFCFEHSCVVGAECVGDSGCASGHCSDGVCCDETCDAPCYSCRAARTGGDHDGVCAPVTEGESSLGACSLEGPCGATGLCDGKGGCAVADKDTECSEPTCATMTAAVAGGRCDGLGGCVLPEAVACAAGYVCSSGDCTRSCETDGDCDTQSGYYCFEHTACASGRRCSSDGAEAVDETGKPAACAPYQCRDGGCLDSCTQTSEDCSSGAACDPFQHACVSEATFTTQRSTSGCRLSSRREEPVPVGWPALLALMLIRKRARPESQASTVERN